VTEVADIWAVIEPYLGAEDLELDDLELTGQGKGRVLRVTIDGPDLGIDRIAEVSRGLSRLLDHETDLDGEYQLEVTSPGLERKLKRPAHFRKAVGREVVVKAALEGSTTTLRGLIGSADDSGFTVAADEDEKAVMYDDVISAKTVFKWEKAPKPGHKEMS
jgi:ribosome maturation factor RimP